MAVIIPEKYPIFVFTLSFPFPMALFQKSVLKKHINDLDKSTVAKAYAKFRSHFADAGKQANIKASKEEQYQEGFLRDLFVDALGYTLNPNAGFNLTTEYKNEKDSKKADGAIIREGMENFKVGDMVVLKSGSPPMTVLNVPNNSSDCLTCVFYKDIDGSFHPEKFPAGVLEFYKKPIKTVSAY
ncbi:MAG: hypothetical protein SFW35_03295 [Chitinophagales bacterium]|nr:hypothetical protein [Chitinophagales bacterium]